VRSPDLEWCGQCYTRYEASPRPSTAQTVLMVVRSRGPGAGIGVSFQWWMRVIITVAVLAGGIVLISGFSPWWELGRARWILAAVLLIVYTSIGAVLAARMWAPETFSSEERIVLLDRGAIGDVERRQQALVEPGGNGLPSAAQQT